jgi:hypothetical protein
LRFSRKELTMQSHDQLLALLYSLLRLANKLLTPEIAAYLSEAGVDETVMRALQDSGGVSNGVHSIRSPGRVGRSVMGLRDISDGSMLFANKDAPLGRSLSSSSQHRSQESFASPTSSRRQSQASKETTLLSEHE